MEEETLPEGWMASHQEVRRVVEGGGEGGGEGVGGGGEEQLPTQECQWNPTLPRGWMDRTI